VAISDDGAFQLSAAATRMSVTRRSRRHPRLIASVALNERSTADGGSESQRSGASRSLPYRIFQAMKAQNVWMLEDRDDVET
jgi:hypothetical protein